MDPGEFQGLLNRLKDKNYLAAAQQEYDNLLETDVSQVIQLHYIILEECEDQILQKLSATLLTKIFQKLTDDDLAELSPFINNVVQTRTILLFQNEDSSIELMDLISYLAATIAIRYIRNGEMLNFLPSLVVVAKTLHPILAPAAINCIEQIVSQVPTDIEKISTELIQALVTGIEQEVSEVFLFYGLNLLYTIILSLHPRINLSEYSAIITPAVNDLIGTIYLHKALLRLSSFVQRRGTFFGDNLQHIVNLLANMISNEEIDNGPRIVSMDILTTVAKATGAAFIQFLEIVFTALLMALDSDLSEDYVEDSVPNTDLIDSIDSTFQSLVSIFSQKNQLQSLAFHCIEAAINSDEWQCRRSGLSFLGKVIHVLHNSLESHLDPIASSVFEHFTDSSPAVRIAAYDTFAEASVSFSPHIEQNYHADVMGTLISAINNESVASTKNAAIKALSRFCENCTPDILEKYSADLMRQLVATVESQQPQQQILIMKCVSYLCEESQESFSQYYTYFIQWLKEIIETKVSDHELVLLKAMAIQNYPIIGEAIDKETFIPDAQELLDTLLEEDWEQMSDEEFDAVQSAIREIAYYIPEFFTNYVPPVLNNLMKIISHDLKPSRSDAHGESASACEVLSIDNPDITYDKHQLNTIKEAILTVNAILEENPTETLDFSLQIGEICYKICTYSFFPDVQNAAIGCFIRLLSNFIKEESEGTEDFAIRLQATVISLLLPQVINPVVTINLLELLIDTIDALSQLEYNCSSVVQHIAEIALMQFQASVQRRNDLSENETCNGENATEYLHEDDLIFSLGLAVRCCFRNFPDVTLKLVPELSKINDPIFQLMLRTDAVCVRDTSVQEISQLVQMILENASVNRMNVIRVAYICFANLVNSAKITLPNELQAISQNAVALIRHFLNEEDETALLAIDGACVALASIFRTQDEIDPEILQLWFDQLPLEKTMEESEIVIEFLIERVMAEDPIILQDDNMERLLTVLSTAAIDPKLSHEVQIKAALCVKSLSRVDQFKNSFEIAHYSLDTEKRIAVQRCLEYEAGS